ncbi:MAG: peptidylprolyl isomerase, partial [Synergistaceae bacterium]|nr:peptidylprolyl isomerase [Synergistaceae bacterium]
MLKHLRTHMRWIMIAIVLAFLLSTFLMYDSGRSRRGPAPDADGRVQDYAVASINGRDLMRSELEIMVRNYVQQSNIRELTSADIPYLFQAALDNAVFQTELNKEVEARNPDVSEQEINLQINSMADRFPTRETFYQSMERSGVKMDDLRRDVRRQIATEKTVSGLLTVEVISDDALRSFYDVMKTFAFRVPKGFTFDIIELSEDKTALDLREKIAADSGGWLETISGHPRSSDVIRKTDEPVFFSEAALSEDKKLSYMISLEIGETGHVTEVSSSDYMIAVKRENREETVMPFDEVSFDIRMMLEQQQQRNALDKFRNDMITRAVLEIY